MRSLNILLKSARLYGFDHERTSAQFGTAWSELQAALPEEGGFLLGVSGSRLLLDGVPLEAAPTERSFAQWLAGAGLGSIHFSSSVTHDDFARFVQAFATVGGKPAPLPEQLKAVLGAESQGTIRLTERGSEAGDAGLAEAPPATPLPAGTLSTGTEETRAWLDDPQKLLQLVIAEDSSAHTTPPAAEPAEAGGEQARVQEGDLVDLIRLLTKLGQASRQPGASAEPAQFQEQLGLLPATAQVTLREALVSLPTSVVARSQTPLLVQLAEHLAVGFALERHRHGELHTGAVPELFDRMSQEIETLRELLRTRERKPGRAGVSAESYADALSRQFWAGVPDSSKRSLLLSPEAWCVPSATIAPFVENLLECNDTKAAEAILLNYADCVHNPQPEARRKVILGLGELVHLYADGDGHLLRIALHQLGEQLSREKIPELQNLLGATFVRLSQEAASRRQYAAVQQALTSLDNVGSAQPALAQSVRPRIGMEGRLSEFIEEALRSPRVPEGLVEVLRRVPQAAVEHLINRFNRCTRRDERERLVELARELGGEIITHLREALRRRPAPEAASTVGLLSRLEATALDEILPMRIRSWNRVYHDMVVRQLASGGAPERGRLLLKLLDALEPLVLPGAVDEIGISGDRTAAPHLLRLAGGDHPLSDWPYLRLKAVEALGRLRDPTAVPVLQQLVEAKQLWRWMHPHELRIVVVQTLAKIDSQWTKSFLSNSGLTAAELALTAADPAPDSPWTRQRRYARLSLPRTLSAVATTARRDCRLTTRELGLGGGLATCDSPLPPGTEAKVKLPSGMRNLHARVLVRDVRAGQLGFEIVDIELDERARLRHMLAALQTQPA